MHITLLSPFFILHPSSLSPSFFYSFPYFLSLTLFLSHSLSSSLCYSFPLSFFISSLCNTVCTEGDARILNYDTYQLSNGTLAIAGILEVCVNGEWSSICYDGSNLTDSDLVGIQAVCSGLGYTGGSCG